MEIKSQLILTVCVVYFSLKYVQPYNPIEDHIAETINVISRNVNDGSKVRENFQNLFASITKNNSEKNKIYHRILKKEVAKEQQAFDAMREEIWTARNRNAHKKRNFYEDSNIIEKREKNENKRDTGTFFALPGVEVPKSSDIQILAEALWFNKQDRCPFVKDFKYKKLKAVKVCDLSKQEAMKYCSLLQHVYNLTDGNYSLIPGGKVEECKPYNVVFYHAGPQATVDKVRARKCPFQPDELFIATGNNRISVFVLTWANVQRKYLLVDHYIDNDDYDEENNWPMNISSALKKPVRFVPWEVTQSRR